MVAGVITDSVVTEGVGAIYVGDAAQVQIDGLGDSISRPGQDDHDVFVNPAGQHSAENRPMVGATVVARTTPLPGGTPSADTVDQVMLGPASQLALPTYTPTPTPTATPTSTPTATPTPTPT
jgi:hypothetical protein